VNKVLRGFVTEVKIKLIIRHRQLRRKPLGPQRRITLIRRARSLGLAAFLLLAYSGCGGPQWDPVKRFAVLPVKSDSHPVASALGRWMEVQLQDSLQAPWVLLPVHTLSAGLCAEDLADEESAASAAARIGLQGYVTVSLQADNTVSLRLAGRDAASSEAYRMALKDFPTDWRSIFTAIDAGWTTSLPSDSLPQAEALETWGRALMTAAAGNAVQAAETLRPVVDRTAAAHGAGLDLIRLLLEAGLDWREDGRDPAPLWNEAARRLQEQPSPKLLGRLYLYQGRLNWAEQAFKSAYSASKPDVALNFDISRIHPSRWPDGGARRQENLLRQNLHLNPLHLPSALALGTWLFGRNETAEVEQVYQTFLSHAPDHRDILMALGRVYVLRNEPVKIIETYRRLIDIDAAYAPAYYNLGVAYFNADRLNEAAGFFTRCLALGGTADSHFYLAALAETRGDTLDALTHYRQRLDARKGREDRFAEEARRRITKLLTVLEPQ